MSSYNNVVGGKLKLKGASLGVDKSLKKKKKKKVSSGEDGAGSSHLAVTTDNLEGERGEEAETPTAPPLKDTRTAAEKRYDEQVRKTEEKRIYEAASKTHREKVKEFNQYLNELSEHNDIPKVGPG